MTFNEYQDKLHRFDVSNGELWYYALGMAEEAGEAVGKVKKFYRDGGLNSEAFGRELGDTLWYLTRSASVVGIDLESVAQGNLEKLTARLRTNTLHGSGDNREQTGA